MKGIFFLSPGKVRVAIILSADAVLETEMPKLIDRVLRLKSKGIHPQLKVILVGAHPASASYVANKKKLCEKAGALSQVLELPEHSSPSELRKLIADLNQDPQTHGILVQLPLPAHLTDLGLERLILPSKDVDGFHEVNLGAMFRNQHPPGRLIPCTPKGIIKLLEHYQISLRGKKVCILGRSQIVGRPLAMLALRYDATVEICHAQTINPKASSLQSDILISAIGKPHFIDSSWCHPGQVVVDVGINRTPQGRLCGDVDFLPVSNVVAAITPVPGGIGKMTVLSLLENLIETCETNF